MFVRADYTQPFNCNGVVRTLEVFRCTSVDKEFVLLEDLKDHFDLTATRLEREDGISLAMMRDSNLQRYVPERIPARRGMTIYIVSNNKPSAAEKACVPTPSPSPTPKTTAQQTPSGKTVVTMLPPASPILTQPTSPTPSWNNRFAAPDAPHSRGGGGLLADSQHPHTPTPSVIDTAFTSAQRSSLHSLIINFPLARAHRSSGSISQTPARAAQDVGDAHHSGASVSRSKSKCEPDLEPAKHTQEFAAGARYDNETTVIGVLERCKGTLARFALVLAKAEEILGTCFDFEHGNGPRLFIILPDPHQPNEGTIAQENQHFRLYFLCECGSHTQPESATKTLTDESSKKRAPRLHLANHEGYVIRQPSKFVERYGPYLLVMLEMVKFGHQIAGYSLPGLSAGPTYPTRMPSTPLTLDNVNKSISYLESVTGLDPSMPWKLEEYLRDLKATDGVNLDNQMSSYLEIRRHGNLFGNMCRRKTGPGRADWVCLLHHTSPFDELESTLSSVGVQMDHNAKKMAVFLTSSSHADGLYNVLTKVVGLGPYHLEATLDFSCSSTYPAKLEQRLAGQSGIESVSVTRPLPPAPSSSPPLPPTVASAIYSSDRRESTDSQSDMSSNFGQSSSRSGSVASDVQPPLYADSTLPDWIYTSRPISVGNHGHEEEFRRQSVELSPYLLADDFTEAERLNSQHCMVQYCFQGNYNVKLDYDADLKILDVATGTGIWAMEMANEFPKADVYGVDMSFISDPHTSGRVVPPNCHFKLCSIADGLPFPDNYFDFIYQRFLVYALTPAQRKQINTELFRVLKPLGHIQLIESDGLIYNAGPKGNMVNNLSLESSLKRSVDPRDVQHLKPGLRRSGFIQVNSLNVALPVGDWGGRLGQLSRDNMHGLGRIWLQGELGRQSRDECEATLVEIDKECEDLQSFYKLWLVVGQKPLL